MAADWRNAPAATSRTPVQNHCLRSMNRTEAARGSIMKISVLEASSRGLPAAVKTP